MSRVDNVKVYGLEEGMVASGYPMRTKTFTKENYKNPTERDLERSKRLANTPIGSGHDNWLNGVVVQFDLTFSLKAWIELQRYHFIDFVSSQSTMHRITEMSIKSNCNSFVDETIIKRLEELIQEYKVVSSKENFLKVIYNIPSGYELTARMTTNYRQLKTMYDQRRFHKLPDWQIFCDWIESLPHSELITGCK